jgi:hypothetical protein
VTISEHLRESPPARSLGWLHTGSWIGGDLRTWSGDRGHNTAWDLLHQARDRVAAGRRLGTNPQVAAAWRHILVTEGSDWFWWFGDHHHTDLDHAWDLNFRLHLQAVYNALKEPVPLELFLPILDQAPSTRPAAPKGALTPTIDGSLGDSDEWRAAGYLAPDLPSTMQPAEGTKIQEVRFGWNGPSLCLLVVPSPSRTLGGLEVEVRLTRGGAEDDLLVHLALEEEGRVEVSCIRDTLLTGIAEAAWKDVLEISLPLRASGMEVAGKMGLIVSIGRDGMTEHVFHSAGLVSLGWGEQ